MSLTSSSVVHASEQEPMSVDMEHDSDASTTRMIISGDIDGLSAGTLQTGVTDAVERYRPAHIELDVHAVTFLDSAGIRTLVACQDYARRVDCHITLVATPPIVYRVLEITALLDHFGVRDQTAR
jgi:anti-anti-sigma factor